MERVAFSANPNTKIVEEGDTFWGIAEEYDTTVDHLKELNSNLDPYAIPIGSEIQIEVKHDDDVVDHIIQPGNTLWEISQVYDGVSVDDLTHLNPDVDPYALQIGSSLTVVDRGDSTDSDYDVIYHTVQPGNTFSEIASVYDYVSAENIMNANPDVDPYSLTIGSKIAIPLK
ncbi:MAG: LysM peptidoglycan-binding domain-containing protein [Bacillaceae bacterium]|nr:LysM peptidoglycan-binding domain-containing protein [Bacillaceae bacterium]